jgi:trigger factor
MKERVKPDASDTVKKELVLDAVVTAEDIEADEHAMMHEVEHLAEDSGRDPQEIVETMRQNGTYSMLEEEFARQKALDFVAENAVAVPMPEEPEEDAEEAAGEPSLEAGEETPGADEEPKSGEASVEAAVETGGSASQAEQTTDGEDKE